MGKSKDLVMAKNSSPKLDLISLHRRLYHPYIKRSFALLFLINCTIDAPIPAGPIPIHSWWKLVNTKYQCSLWAVLVVSHQASFIIKAISQLLSQSVENSISFWKHFGSISILDFTYIQKLKLLFWVILFCGPRLLLCGPAMNHSYMLTLEYFLKIYQWSRNPSVKVVILQRAEWYHARGWLDVLYYSNHPNRTVTCYIALLYA